MRHLFILFAILFFASGCSKDKGTYTIVAQNMSSEPARLEIDDIAHTVTGTEYKQDVHIDKYDVISVSFDYLGSGMGSLTLSIYKGDDLVATVSGNTYMYVILSRESATKGGGGTYSSGGPGSGSGSSICGAPTKDGTPCQRKVSGGGYCWQHD